MPPDFSEVDECGIDRISEPLDRQEIRDRDRLSGATLASIDYRLDFGRRLLERNNPPRLALSVFAMLNNLAHREGAIGQQGGFGNMLLEHQTKDLTTSDFGHGGGHFSAQPRVWNLVYELIDAGQMSVLLRQSVLDGTDRVELPCMQNGRDISIHDYQRPMVLRAAASPGRLGSLRSAATSQRSCDALLFRL